MCKEIEDRLLPNRIHVQLEPKNYSDRLVRHYGWVLWTSTKDCRGSENFSDDSLWKVHNPGLDGWGVSFESVNYPNHYVRHYGDRLRIDRYCGDYQFKRDATWIGEPPNEKHDSGGCISLKAGNMDKWVRHSNDKMITDRENASTNWFGWGGDNEGLFKLDSTFKVIRHDEITSIRVSAKLLQEKPDDPGELRFCREVEMGFTHTQQTNTKFAVKMSAKTGELERLWAGSVEGETEFEIGFNFEDHRSRNFKQTFEFKQDEGKPAYVYQWIVQAKTTDPGVTMDWNGPLIMVSKPLRCCNEATFG